MPTDFARTLLVVCLASAAWAFSFGVGSQVVSHWLHAHDASNTVIGLNHAVYYLGLALASLAVPRLLRRHGSRAAAWGMVASGLTLAAFPWGGGVPGWFVLRFLNGCAGALSLIPLETLVSKDSPAEQRTRNFGFYAVALTLGGAVGIGAGLHLYEPGQTFPFYLGATFPVVAGLVLAARLPSSPTADEPTAATPFGWRRHFLSFGTAWYQGFLEGGMLAFLSLYLLAQGLSADLAGGLMGVAMVGVILFQVPVAWLADRLGGLSVLLGCYAVVALGLALMPFLTDWLWLGMCLFLFGACSGAMYPLGLSLLGGRGRESELARAYAWYLALECVGSQTGAAAMGPARDLWGEASMFAVGLAAMLPVLLPWLLLRGTKEIDRTAFEAPNESRRAA